MNRKNFQSIARLRRSEAAALLKTRYYAGAYYLIGYAVESGLKACIAKQTKRHDFPDKSLVKQVFTHDLEKLVKLSGLATTLETDLKANKNLELNWAIVKDWTEQSRYEMNISNVQALDMYSACTARTHGVLTWISKRW